MWARTVSWWRSTCLACMKSSVRLSVLRKKTEREMQGRKEARRILLLIQFYGNISRKMSICKIMIWGTV